MKFLAFQALRATRFLTSHLPQSRKCDQCFLNSSPMPLLDQQSSSCKKPCSFEAHTIQQKDWSSLCCHTLDLFITQNLFTSKITKTSIWSQPPTIKPRLLNYYHCICMKPISIDLSNFSYGGHIQSSLDSFILIRFLLILWTSFLVFLFHRPGKIQALAEPIISLLHVCI